MLTPQGGIECDLTVTRLAADRFYLITAAGTETHDLDWIERHAPPDGSVVVEDVTGRWGVLMLAGPRSRDLLASLTDADLSRTTPSRSSAHAILEVGGARVLCLRVTYVGRLGWEFHHPIEVQRDLYGLLTRKRGGSRPRRTSAIDRSTRCGSRRATGCGAST